MFDVDVAFWHAPLSQQSKFTIPHLFCLTQCSLSTFNGLNAEEAKVTIHFEDADTGETFNTTVFPDDMNNQ